MVEAVIQAMQNLGVCQPDKMCGYHKTKVGISMFPPSEVWGKPLLEELSKQISSIKQQADYSNLPLTRKIHTILTSVNLFWEQYKSELNNDLWQYWKTWDTDTKAKGKYSAGSWVASPQQLSQLVESLKVLNEENLEGIQTILRCGTASGTHTQQEVFAAGKAGIKKPKFTIVDPCLPPLIDSLIKAKSSVANWGKYSVLKLFLYKDRQFDIVTGHFLESFIPTAEQYKAGMTHEQAIQLKQEMINEMWRVTKHGVILATGVGNDRRWSIDEIRGCFCQAGCLEENIIIITTTDPLVYDEQTKTHKPGNYFVIALKN